MKMQDVLLRAMAKKITWWQAAEIIGVSARTMRRWRERLEEDGYDGLAPRRFSESASIGAEKAGEELSGRDWQPFISIARFLLRCAFGCEVRVCQSEFGSRAFSRRQPRLK